MYLQDEKSADETLKKKEKKKLQLIQKMKRKRRQYQTSNKG